jgi:hypothetical protein
MRTCCVKLDETRLGDWIPPKFKLIPYIDGTLPPLLKLTCLPIDKSTMRVRADGEIR